MPGIVITSITLVQSIHKVLVISYSRENWSKRRKKRETGRKMENLGGGVQAALKGDTSSLRGPRQSPKSDRENYSPESLQGPSMAWPTSS